MLEMGSPFGIDTLDLVICDVDVTKVGSGDVKGLETTVTDRDRF